MLSVTARVGGAEGPSDTITIYVSNYINNPTKVDDDGNGLIEILNLTMLHNMRHNLAGTNYKTNSSDGGDDSGCPAGGCNGYELVQNLSFDTDGDGTWSGSDGSYTLDNNDNHSVYFNVSQGGWDPIGDDSNPFTAIFEGNGFVITGLAIRRDRDYVGMFGYIDNAHIRGLGLVSNLADYTGSSAEIRYIGGLVGQNIRGHIFNSYTTGNASGGSGANDYVGGLVGSQARDNIAACYTTGDVNGGGGDDRVGGIVGYQSSANITSRIVACYTTGTISGGEANDRVGGIVGFQQERTDQPQLLSRLAISPGMSMEEQEIVTGLAVS